MILSSTAKAGKSFCLANLLRAVATGGKLWGHSDWKTSPTRVLLVDKELGKYSLSKRLRSIFTKEESDAVRKCKFLSRPKRFNLSDSTCVAWLKKFAHDEGIGLIVLDPVGRMHSYDTKDISNTTRLLDVFDALQEDSISLAVAQHNVKPPRGRDAEDYDPLDFYNARSAGLVEDADLILMLDRQEGRLVVDYESWSLNARMTLRHGESPEDFMLYVNEHGDGRVEYRPMDVPEPKPRAPREGPRGGSSFLL